jgi:DeoR family suf operon transcriptional repressor
MEDAVARNAGNRRFLASTRGRILTLLRRQTRTVDDLAETLDLSDNAVRSQLQTLERDGLVTYESTRRGPGKPAHLYRLAPNAERVFPKSYATVLDNLLQVLGERLPPGELEAALDEVGQRLARTVRPLTGSTEERIPGVIEAFAGIGGLAELDASGASLVIQGYDCPIARAVQGYPGSCRVLQAMLETVLEQPVTESCDKSDPPRCRFVITLPSS